MQSLSLTYLWKVSGFATVLYFVHDMRYGSKPTLCEKKYEKNKIQTICQYALGIPMESE